MGDKTVSFVRKAAEVAQQNSDFLPRSFDVTEFVQDVALFDELHAVALALAPLNELIDDTLVQVGSEAYAAALVVYQYAKNAGQGAGLDAVADDLGKRFAKKTPTPTPGPTPPTA